MTTPLLVLAIAEVIELLWLGVLTAAWVAQRRRHDRLMYRVSGLSKSVTKISRMRHTGSQPAIGPQTGKVRALPSPPPPFPVAPPSTSPITSTGGRHSA